MRTVLLFIALSVLALSCSSSRNRAEAYPAGPDEILVGTAEGGPGKARPNQSQTDRKVLFSAYLLLVVEHPDTANRAIEQIAEKYKGYVNELGTYRSVIRVESGMLEAAITDIATLGKVQRRSMLGQDVTEEYLDYQIRLENAQKARDRYLELLNKAQTVEEILKVEKELERLNETIDLLKGRMNRIDHLAEYSTITIELKEKKKPGLLGYIGLGLYHAVKWLFVRN